MYTRFWHLFRQNSGAIAIENLPQNILGPGTCPGCKTVTMQGEVYSSCLMKRADHRRDPQMSQTGDNYMDGQSLLGTAGKMYGTRLQLDIVREVALVQVNRLLHRLTSQTIPLKCGTILKTEYGREVYLRTLVTRSHLYANNEMADFEPSVSDIPTNRVSSCFGAYRNVCPPAGTIERTVISAHGHTGQAGDLLFHVTKTCGVQRSENATYQNGPPHYDAQFCHPEQKGLVFVSHSTPFP